MIIHWNENPLLTKIELSEADIKLYHKNALEDLGSDYDEFTFNGFLDDVINGEPHCGDCTCVPMSCAKCEAEHHLGLSTIDGCDKYMLNHISRAFKDYKTSEAALDYLKNYFPVYDENDKRFDWKQIAIHWKAQATRAHDWLEKYLNDHIRN